ncbi:mucin-2-like isoform X1 [Colletes gigas]|uniref:mucin-2-like isoform X1 n=1 Tax=Colletes gigas TaxID=935657 RepID=UPI001C9BA684|nr:mucin-2-like isoform X1 [Colletes gigas]
MSSRSIDVNRNTESNMSRMHRALIVLSIIGCVAFPFGSALKCYVCVPSTDNSCKSVNASMSKECPAVKPSTTTVKPTTEEATTETTTTEATTTEATTTEETTTEETTTEASTTEDTTTEASTTEDTTTETSTTEDTTTETSTTEDTTTEASTTEASTTEGSFAAYYARQTNRRSLMDRLSPMHPFADETKVYCYSQTSKVTRGCSTDEHACSQSDDCKTCTTDECNSATSNIVFTSMIMSLVIALIIAN